MKYHMIEQEVIEDTVGDYDTCHNTGRCIEKKEMFSTQGDYRAAWEWIVTLRTGEVSNLWVVNTIAGRFRRPTTDELAEICEK